jgi:hypothetical protein
MKRLILFASFVALLVYADLPSRKPFPGFARVKLSIRTDLGKPAGVRLRVTNAAGEYFAPLGHLPAYAQSREPGDEILGDGKTSPYTLYALVYDGAQIDLPPGAYTFSATKGFEYEPVRQVVEISTSGPNSVSLKLRKFADFEARGWFPGDTHLHFPDPAGVRYEMECEGLRVCSLLLYKGGLKTGKAGEGVFHNAQDFTGKLSPVSDSEHFIKVGEEFRSGLLAHLIFQNLKSIVWPVSTGGLKENGPGGFDWPLMLHAADDAHEQGALVSWAHFPYPSFEAPMDIALGRIDSIDLLTTGSPFEPHPVLIEDYKMHGPAAFALPPIEVYYHYLNCGFHLAASGGSDKMGLNPPLGSARTYVRTDGPLTYDSWVEGIRKGHTFTSTYPLLEFSVDGKEAGETLHLAPGKVKLHVRARARSIEAYDWLEVMYNGKAIRRVKPSGEQNDAAIDDTIEVERGGWIAARAYGAKLLPYGATWWQQPVFAHTSPIYLDMPGTHAPAGESAKLFLDQLGYLERWAESQANFPSAESKQEALNRIAEAKQVYEKLN